MLGASFRSKIVEFPNTNAVAANLDSNGESGRTSGDGQNSVADAVNERPSTAETNTDRLLNLLSELRSFADKACDAAVREAECAEHIKQTMGAEVNGLLEKIKEKDESLRAQEAALVKLEETSKAKFAELESRLREQESQLKNREVQSQHLASERDFLIGRLKEAEIAAQQAEAKAREFTERTEAELSDLRLQIAKREESLAARDMAICQFEGDLRTYIQTLQLRLQDTTVRLAKRQRELGVAADETEPGKLIDMIFGK